MDMSALKAKAKEKKDQTWGFVRRHWKEILIVAGTIGIGIAVVRSLPSDHSDDEIEIAGDNDDDNFDSNSYTGIDVCCDCQTNVKNPPKRYIGAVEVTGTRLKENEKQFLEELQENYDKLKGKEQTIETKRDSWSSDGKYTRYTKTKHSFGEDKVSITVDQSYIDDDGQTGNSSISLENGRDIIKYVKENRNSKMLDDVRDIVDIL